MRLAGGAAADRGLPRALSEQLHHVGNSNANMHALPDRVPFAVRGNFLRDGSESTEGRHAPAFHRTQCQPHVIPCLTTVACFTISGGTLFAAAHNLEDPKDSSSLRTSAHGDCKPWASAWLPPLHRHASARGRRRNVPALEAAKNEATDDHGRQILRLRGRIANIRSSSLLVIVSAGATIYYQGHCSHFDLSSSYCGYMTRTLGDQVPPMRHKVQR
ncbi:hypothetical protein KC361_g173 [Hortaea werneckii]|nr:hypothetical protein KC361_g173 [Hortaea werneckii]